MPQSRHFTVLDSGSDMVKEFVVYSHKCIRESYQILENVKSELDMVKESH